MNKHSVFVTKRRVFECDVTPCYGVYNSRRISNCWNKSRNIPSLPGLLLVAPVDASWLSDLQAAATKFLCEMLPDGTVCPLFSIHRNVYNLFKAWVPVSNSRTRNRCIWWNNCWFITNADLRWVRQLGVTVSRLIQPSQIPPNSRQDAGRFVCAY